MSATRVKLVEVVHIMGADGKEVRQFTREMESTRAFWLEMVPGSENMQIDRYEDECLSGNGPTQDPSPQA